MSRIHEALKKAEEEKRASVGGASVPLSSAAAEPIMATLPERYGAAVAPAAEPEMAVDTLSWKRIVERCPQRAWQPEPSMLFFNGKTHHEPGMEEFRTLRSRLYHIREKRALKTILVGSALPAEGKTFITVNLAQSLARQHGRHVVAIDCDLRRSRLHEPFGTSSQPGVTEYLRGEADELAILQRGPMENLAFIPGGATASNPAELIANGRLETLVKRLGEVFDWIVIDSPPAVPVSDAGLIARICDGILLVIMAGTTPFDAAQRARQEFRNMPLLGVVLNRVRAGSTYSSYYYGHYLKEGKAGTK
jgi:capsular exopolysaccharide synthesis family protein